MIDTINDGILYTYEGPVGVLCEERAQLADTLLITEQLFQVS